jgi:hypothetical protein
VVATVGAIAVPTTNSMKMIETDEKAERQRRTQPPYVGKSWASRGTAITA